MRAATRSLASQIISNDSPLSFTSSAPASRTASRIDSSVAPDALLTVIKPLRLNKYETEPGSAIEPPLRVTATRTSEAARFLLSDKHSIMIATPDGPYPSYIIVSQLAPPDSRPAPRFIARSILSAGIEFFLAFATASKSVGFPSMSGPPLREATSIALISLAKFFARRLSMTAFLCLVVAHLEWPDI